MFVQYTYVLYSKSLGQPTTTLTAESHGQVVTPHRPNLILRGTVVRPGIIDLIRALNRELSIGQSVPVIGGGTDVIHTAIVGYFGDSVIRLRITVSYALKGCCNSFADHHNAARLYQESWSLWNFFGISCVKAIR